MCSEHRHQITDSTTVHILFATTVSAQRTNKDDGASLKERVTCSGINTVDDEDRQINNGRFRTLILRSNLCPTQQILTSIRLHRLFCGYSLGLFQSAFERMPAKHSAFDTRRVLPNTGKDCQFIKGIGL